MTYLRMQIPRPPRLLMPHDNPHRLRERMERVRRPTESRSHIDKVQRKLLEAITKRQEERWGPVLDEYRATKTGSRRE